MKTQQFSIVVEKDTDGFTASCPSLQGCYAQGTTYDECLTNIEDAIKLHISDREDGEMPQQTTITLATIEISL